MRRFVPLALAALLTLAPGRVHAQSAQDLQTARELFKEATELHDAKDLKGALVKFKAAHELASTPVTGIELAKTYVELGLFTEAREVALGIDRIPVKPNESEKAKQARADAVALADSLRARIASLTIVIDNAPQASTAQVSVDGLPIPAAALVAPRKVNPGAHVVVASLANGPPTTMNVTLGEGEARTLHVTLQLPPEPTPAPTPPPPTPPPPTPIPTVTNPPPPEQTPVVAVAPSGNAQLSAELRTWAGVSAALGIGGLVGGTLFGVGVLAEKSTLDSHCNAFQQCDSKGLSTAKTARDLATGANVCFALGGAVSGVAIVLGILSAVTAPSRPMERARVIVSPIAGGFAIGSAGTF